MSTKKGKSRTSLGIIAFYSSSPLDPFSLSRRTEVDCLHSPNASQAIFDSVLSRTGSAELPAYLQWWRWNTPAEIKLGEREEGERQWDNGCLKELLFSVYKDKESNVPSVLAQSALAGYDLSMILNGQNIFSLYISTFCDGAENPPQPQEIYCAAVKFNGSPVRFLGATTASTQTMTTQFTSLNNFLYDLGKSTSSSSMYSGGKNAISQALQAQKSLLQCHHLFFPHTGITTSRSPLKH